MAYHRGSALTDVYAAARRNGYGFVASNVTHPDIATGLVRGAVESESDIVVQIKRDTAEYFGDGDVEAGLQVLGAQLQALAADTQVGVFLNVDHVDYEDEALIGAAISSGIPASLMVDASRESFETNVASTRAVVDRIESAGADMLVEAELGTIAGEESGEVTEEALYTRPEEAVEFVRKTGCDLLAVSIGTQHGVAAGHDLDLRVDLTAEIGERLREEGYDVPLVVHGSSGLTPEQVSDLMETGVCKLNTNTRYQYEFARTACEFYRDNADAIIPPSGVTDDRTTFFADTDWSPRKAVFDPRVVGERARGRIAAVYEELAEVSGSAGRSLYA